VAKQVAKNQFNHHRRLQSSHFVQITGCLQIASAKAALHPLLYNFFIHTHRTERVDKYGLVWK
jgi:hypothetical protein